MWKYSMACLAVFLLSKIGASMAICSNRAPKIVGGSEAQRHEMPFIVSLMRRRGHICGATIINERWLLTAGHCICNGLNQFLKPNQIQGVMGLHSINTFLNQVDSAGGPTLINFKRLIAHPNYRCNNVEHDLALLELQTPINFGRSDRSIQAACLPVVDFSSSRNYENEYATVSGWGWTNENKAEGERADVLRKAEVKIWNNDVCQKSYHANGKPHNFIFATQMCAGFEKGGVDSCWADSGGPLVSKENVLIGVVSTGVGCARPGLPGIYTRVNKYVGWIQSMMVL